MRRFIRDNGLSLVLVLLSLITLLGQSVAGHLKDNEERDDHGKEPVTYLEYLKSPAFMEATAENWESEFLQLFTYAILTAFLYQRGSAESNDPDKQNEAGGGPVDTQERENVPWPVKRGGLVLKVYEHSLSLTFLLLFIVSFTLHAIGGAGEFNQEQADHGRPERVGVLQFIGTSTFWFQSLQNWQSEFLSILLLVVLSIFLREKGSSQSKPVEAPHRKTEK